MQTYYYCTLALYKALSPRALFSCLFYDLFPDSYQVFKLCKGAIIFTRKGRGCLFVGSRGHFFRVVLGGGQNFYRVQEGAQNWSCLHAGMQR